MGKHKHSKDRLYVTRTEQELIYGGKAASHTDGANAAIANYRAFRLPFSSCALSLQPFTRPVATPDGTVYDLMNIMPYINKYHSDPVTGEKLETSQLISLNFHKNDNGNYHCPILYTEFRENSHIVAITTSGNVYSFKAVQELNIKGKNFTDLISGEKFTRKDVITLQDPNAVSMTDKVNPAIREKALQIKKDMQAKGELAAGNILLNEPKLNSTASRILEKIKQGEGSALGLRKREHEFNTAGEKSDKRKKSNQVMSSLYTTGKAAASFTSTANDIVTNNEMRAMTDLEFRTKMYRKIIKKGYVKLETNFGDMKIELHCDLCPETCHNFLRLATDTDTYRNCKFHRSIRNFMIQGGDPTSTGRGGESYFGGKFKDEIRGSLRHDKEGIVSMANSGPNSNGSQFFILYGPVAHLDGKHTVFGHAFDEESLSVLRRIQNVKTDSLDRPIEEIILKRVLVYEDPYAEFEKPIPPAKDEIRLGNTARKPGEMKPNTEATESELTPSSNTKVGKYLGKNK